MRVLVLGMGIAVFVLAGCQSLPQNEGDPASVADVVSAIKQDISKYQEYDEAEEEPFKNVCGGIVGFSIEKVTVSLTIQIDNTISDEGSATLPVGSTGFWSTVVGASQEINGTQTLTFTLYPNQKKPSEICREACEPIDPQKYPIASSLRLLRQGLLEAGQEKPCVSLVPPASREGNVKDEEDTYVFGFTVIKKNAVREKLRFLVFSLGAGKTAESQVGNSITVTFKARQHSAALH